MHVCATFLDTSAHVVCFHPFTALLPDLFIHILIIYNTLCLPRMKSVTICQKWKVEHPLLHAFGLI